MEGVARLYNHQRDIIEQDPLTCGLFMGTGSGKSATALCLAEGRTIVVAPKTQRDDMNWHRELGKLNAAKIPVRLTSLMVISKEDFRRDWNELPSCDTLIFDEAHTILGINPSMGWKKGQRVVRSSQLFSAAQQYIERVEPERLYLCTATPVRNPLCVWGAAKLLGHEWDFETFRDTFYIKLPMPGREIWRPKTDAATKNRLAKAVGNLGYTGRLDDWFDVPEQLDITQYVGLTPAQKKKLSAVQLEFPDPIVLLGKRHQVENGVLAGSIYEEGEMLGNEKLEKVLELCDEFPKVLIFARYLMQVKMLKDALEKEGKNVFVLTGSTKERGALIKEAEAAKSAVFIAQASVSAGYELPSFGCVVYASLSWSLVDYEQSRGRVLRANKLKKNIFVHLVVRGGIDEHVYKTIMQKKDFNEAIFVKENPDI